MTYRAMFFNILMSIACCVYSPIIVAGQQKMGMPQMQDFEKELEEANRAIEEYVASLPPAEQAEFNRQVNEMSRMFENMSEDEFEKFLGEMFTEEQGVEPNPFIEIQPNTLEVTEVTLNAEDKKKAETALKVLDDIIKQSNLFMVIINSSPELPNRITRWGAKGNISNWQAGSDWNSFKLELETLVQNLYKAEEQDVTTKKYKYLLELIADETLYNNLIQLQTSLNVLVPTINLPEFSVQKLSAQSKTAIKDILKKYTEGFYLLTIPKSLNALFEKYAPEAEKIKAAEEAANKRSLENAKNVRTPAAQSEAAGTGAESMGYDYGYGQPQYYGGDYNPYDSYSQYGGGDYGYSPDYGYGSDTGAGAGRSSGGGGGGSSGGSTGGENGKEEPGKEEEGRNRQSKFMPNIEIEAAIADIKTSLDDIKAAMIDEEGNPTKLATLADSINKEDVDVILAGSTLPAIVDKKIDTINKSFETINKKVLTPGDLSHYQREVQKSFDRNKKELESLRDAINTFGTKEEIKKEEEQAKKSPVKESDKTKSKKIDIATLSPEKQWAYFGEEATVLGEDKDKLEDTITSRVSLLDIKTKIDTLFEDMKKFMAKKSDIPVAPITPKKKEVPVQEAPSVEFE